MFFYLGFLSQALTIHRTAGKGEALELLSTTSTNFSDT